MPETRQQTGGEEAVVQHLVHAQVTRHGDVANRGEIRRTLVHHARLVIPETVIEQIFLRRHGMVEPSIGGDDVVRPGAKRFHRHHPGAASEVQHARVPRVGAKTFHGDGNGGGEGVQSRHVFQIFEVSARHANIRLDGEVIVRVSHVVVVLRLERSQQPRRERVARMKSMQRRGVRKVGDGAGDADRGGSAKVSRPRPATRSATTAAVASSSPRLHSTCAGSIASPPSKAIFASRGFPNPTSANPARA